jgi:hypothetical protein
MCRASLRSCQTPIVRAAALRFKSFVYQNTSLQLHDSLVFNDKPFAAGEINTIMADMISTDMRTFASRVATFQQPHQLSKRRASSQGKKKNQQTTEWPHENPSPEEVCMRCSEIDKNTANIPTARTRRFLLQAQPRLQRQCTMFPMRREIGRMGSVRQPTARTSGTFKRLRMGALSLLLPTRGRPGRDARSHVRRDG